MVKKIQAIKLSRIWRLHLYVGLCLLPLGITSGQGFAKTSAELLDEPNLTSAELAQLENELESLRSEARKPEDKPVDVSEIASWQLATDRLAVGFGSDGNLLAAYDLSLPNPLQWRQTARIILGSIGVGDLNLRDLIRYIKDKIAERRNEPIKHKKLRKVAGQLNDISDRYGDRSNTFPAGWENRVQWKGQNPLLTSDRFSFDQVDLFAMAKKEKKFAKALAKFREEMLDNFHVDVGSNFFNNFELVRLQPRGFEVRLKVSGDPGSENNLKYSKVLDFRAFQVSWRRALARKVVQELIQGAAGMIPEPTTATILKVIIKRFFRLLDSQEALHRHSVWEHVDNAALGTGVSPLQDLTDEQKVHAGVYVTSNDANFLRRIIKRKEEKDWRKEMDKDLAQATLGRGWLGSNGFAEVAQLNHWYGTWEAQDKLKLFILPMHFLAGPKPIVAVDYHRPNVIRIERNLAEVMQVALDVIDVPVPILMTGLQTLFEYLVIRSIDKSKEREARLSSHLLQRIDGGETQWETELEILYKQRLNPFMLTRAEERELIAHRREAMGL